VSRDCAPPQRGASELPRRMLGLDVGDHRIGMAMRDDLDYQRLSTPRPSYQPGDHRGEQR
ncbi:MAG: hypothetical protein V3R80_01035, partial [Candidatus Tectomicrobia bacterium]